MHDIRSIRENPAAFDQGLRNRGMEPLSARLIALDDRRKSAVSALQAATERRNALSKEIGQAKAKKDEARAQELMAEVARIKESMPELEEAERAAEKALFEALAGIPNIPKAEVPVGADEHGNVERHRVGNPRNLAAARQHFEIGEALGLMDFETAAKLSGSRFVVLKGGLARLERALGQFMIDLHVTEHGYTEVNPPLLVRDEAMFGTTQLPKFEEDQFWAFPGSALWEIVSAALDGQPREAVARMVKDARYGLIPTAEVTLTNLVREQILSEEELPLRFTALTPSFRAEAGSAGRDTRGMIRQHQFVKCELVSITTPETSADEHERMLACAENVLKKLELPFRTMTLCTGDMGFASTKTYDIEVWLPGQGAYREISSCSVCSDFQARRMNARYRPAGEKQPRFVHTLNGSGLAVGRTLVAVLENYQNEDGSVTIPSVLQPYMGGVTRIERQA
ncbi:serine--tRNA ligase [Microvirga arsenatis]|uniref:Serine--tRNA ligase n=1 Tax=Microvirga arsenatis TaxID=2692265 RepID=A0ABW9YSG4_9HYPH|nr:serine--tRNA ligase [Microvirga arsenatis]NBJ09956.1 serine--tRNA ligase [Microvirga arsenatis]NBJ23024.1 serine--tRNA ligase [Microvirga arsenatis]